MKASRANGFTLIEVLLALAIVSIALVALIRASAQTVHFTHRIKEKTISHWIAMQGVAMVQLGLLPVSTAHEVSQITTMLGQRWYWRVKTRQTPIQGVLEITVRVSKNQAGPFTDPLIAYRYAA